MSLSRKSSLMRPRGLNEAQDEHATSSLEALPSTIFEQRLYAWKSTIKQLILYFQAIAEVEQQSARGYTKVFNSIQIPLKEGHHLLPIGSNGVQDVVAAVNNTTQQLYEHHAEFTRLINDQIVGNLSRLKADIKARLLSSKKELINHESSLGRERQSSAKIISEYDQACHNTENNIIPNGKTAPIDPWLVHNTLQKQLQRQISQENSFHKTMLSAQKSLEIFEASIVETLKNTLDSYYKWRTTYTSKLLDQANYATQSITALAPNLEWNSFFEKNQPPLISPESTEITMDAINYPNKGSQLTDPKKYGVIERQGGVFKSARRDHCFLTPSGYLHGYSQSDPISGSPDFSIHLPSSIMRGYSESSLAFEIAEKGSGGLFHRSEHSYVFKFLTKEDLGSWWNAIKEYTKSTEETPFNNDSQAIAPATAAGIGAAENSEPIIQEQRAVGEPITTAQSAQPPVTELASHNTAIGAQGAQQPTSSMPQQTPYPAAVPQQYQNVAQQQAPQLTNDQSTQQPISSAHSQPQYSTTTAQQQQMPQFTNNQAAQQPVSSTYQQSQYPTATTQQYQNLTQQQQMPQFTNDQGFQQQNPAHATQQSEYTPYPMQGQQSVEPIGHQAANYSTSQAVPNASQMGSSNDNTMVGVPGQMPE